MQQSDATVQQLQQELQKLQAEVQDKQADRDHKAQLAEMDAQVKLAIARMNNESKENLNELTQAVKLMLQHMQVPASLAQQVNQGLAMITNNMNRRPRNIPMQDINPLNAGFSLPESNMGQQPMPQEQQQMQQNYAPDTSQIENNAPQWLQ
ncbi:hypothetical protein [Aquirhabdus parva]|uniref:hypothetical protein n=1 Tax=Aquirhabdus parva TaxID=2283318 RepID=UPI0013B3D3C2|nr:hypothetical protein [Aquirhabdus parva]